jgi:predicted AlkP superfamily pyrophosphatase or phosphodiesterase
MSRFRRCSGSRRSGWTRRAASLLAAAILILAGGEGLRGVAVKYGVIAGETMGEAAIGEPPSNDEVGVRMVPANERDEDGTATSPAAEHVLYINWDAFRRDYYDWANEEGTPGTPNLNYLASRGALFTAAHNGFPSITNPMQTSIVTGAWPGVHGNIYRYYDVQGNIVQGTGRICEAETIAEAVAASGLSTASVQQFMLRGRGTADDDPLHLYIQPGGRFEERAAEAVKIIRGDAVRALSGAMITSAEIPRFMAIYGDDLDAAGHNSGAGYGAGIAFTYDQWKAKMVRELVRMDGALGTLMGALADAGIMERTAIILTADHGMTPYWGRSSLSDLVRVLQSLGYKPRALSNDQKAPAGTDVVLVGTGISVQVYFRRELSPNEYRAVVEAISAQPYVGGCLTRDDLDQMGAHSRSGDLVVWSNPPHHFANSNITFGIGGNHDTYHPSSRNVFLLVSGAGVQHGVVIDHPVEIIDVAPTISKLLGIRSPAQSTGRVLEEALRLR